ncbi:MAG: SDR family NAD(P)-dependent oxidoreductase [Pseudomonadota bacterium]
MKNVLITGASSGIGAALVRAYSANGWQVTACGRDTSRLQALADETGCSLVEFDVADRAACVDKLTELSTTWDLVVLNAGTCEYVDDVKRFDARLFERVMQVNVLGTANCLEALLPKMQSGSRVAIVGSMATYLPFERASAYGGSKAALAYMAGSLATDLAPHGVGVSLVSPGFVETPLTDKNDFNMPMIITAEQAALTIKQGLDKGKHHVCAPWLFCAILRVLGRLPAAWRVGLAKRMAK